MKRFLLLLALPLMACAPEEMPDQSPAPWTGGPDAGVGNAEPVRLAPGTTQMVMTHLGPEERLATRMLPMLSPSAVISQGDWEQLRGGRKVPTSRAQRTALGMTNRLCSDDEICDRYNDCDGTDTDGRNGDGVDFTEYPALSVGAVSGWSNCADNNEYVPWRCNGKLSADMDYTSTQCLGCNTNNYQTALMPPGEAPFTEQLVIFTGDNYDGYCARFSRGEWFSPPTTAGAVGDSYSLTTSLMNSVHTVFNDAISSFRWSGHCAMGASLCAGFPAQRRGSIEVFEGDVNEGQCGGHICGHAIFMPLTAGNLPYNSANWGSWEMNNTISGIRINAVNPN